MNGDRVPSLTRLFLYVLVGSIGLGAVLAIVIVLRGSWSWFETRVLLTTAVIAVGSVYGMACAAAVARTGSRLPGVGILLTAVGSVMLIVGMWAEFQSMEYWKAAATTCIFATAAGYASVLALARLLQAHRWAILLASAAALLFAAILSGILWGEASDQGVYRALAVAGILAAAFGLMVPVFHFLDRRAIAGYEVDAAGNRDAPDDLASIDAELAMLRARMTELEAARTALMGGEAVV